MRVVPLCSTMFSASWTTFLLNCTFALICRVCQLLTCISRSIDREKQTIMNERERRNKAILQHTDELHSLELKEGRLRNGLEEKQRLVQEIISKRAEIETHTERIKELDGKVQQTHVGESRGERAAWRVIVPSRPSRHGWECRMDKKIRPEGDSNTRVQSTMPGLRLRVVAGHHLNHSVI